MKLLPMAMAMLVAGLTMSLGAPRTVDMNQRAKELESLHWGMFICWSFSTSSGKEWTPGVKDVSYFRAVDVATDPWALTAKEAAMGYILI